MSNYSHLAYEQRYQIGILNASGIKQKIIAEKLGIAPSTVCRELKRCPAVETYCAKQAQQHATQLRANASRRSLRLTQEIKARVITHLKQFWSPEQIAGRLKKEAIHISHETIYQHIWTDKKQGGTLFQFLRHHGKKYNKRAALHAGRGCIPGRVDISQRPPEVELKQIPGHWEADTIIGAQHQGAVLTVVERVSKFVKIAPLSRKTADSVVRQMKRLFHDTMYPLLTMTFDNGKEFAQHQTLSKHLKIDCYFAQPYHSWERGLNEHTNGLIRQFLPKSKFLTHASYALCKKIEDVLNNRPRKVLNFLTPREVLNELTQNEKIALGG